MVVKVKMTLKTKVLRLGISKLSMFPVYTLFCFLKHNLMFLKSFYRRLARTTKRVTRVVLNRRSRQKALRKMETKEKLKEKISKEIDR